MTIWPVGLGGKLTMTCTLLSTSELLLTRYMYHTVDEARGTKRGR